MLMFGAASGIAGSPPPRGGEVERRVNLRLDTSGIPPSLTLPHKGGGSSPACTNVFAGNGLGSRA
jgi:hypothetical protein